MHRARKAVSPIVATIMMLGMVMTIGGATWSYANTAIGTTLQKEGQDVAKDVNTLQERYSIVNLLLNRTVYPSPNQDQVTLWIYNNGGAESIVWDIWVSGSESFGSPIPSTQYDPTSSYRNVRIGVGELKSIVLKINATGLTDIHIKVVGQYGDVFTYLQRAS